MPSKQLTVATHVSCTLASDDDAGLARWAEHFAALLGGKQVDNVKAATFERHEDEKMLQLCNTLDLSPEAVSKILRRLSKQRAVGPDGIASEIWIAGGDKLSELLSELMRRVVVSGTVPPQWKGGRLARLYEGERRRCGLQLAPWLVNSRPRFQGVHLFAAATDCASVRPTFAYGAVWMRARGWHGSCDAHEQTICEEGSCA